MHKLAAIAGVVFATSLAVADPAFTTKLDAAKSADGVHVRFAVSEPTDVAVTIRDAAGKPVRHLAAGMLGKNAPPPLAKDSLVQDLVWDGKDDRGAPAPGGPFHARVDLGTRPALSRMIGDNPGALGSARGVAVGPNGELYVLHIYGRVHPEENTLFCTVFSRDGKYLRTIIPYPANLAEDKLTGVKRLELEGGVKAPFLYDADNRQILAGAGNIEPTQPVVLADGRLVFIGHHEIAAGTMLRYNNAGIRQVTVVNADGSMPPGGPYRTVLAARSECMGALAASPDGKMIYAASIFTGKDASDAHAVYRFSLDDKQPTVFVGTPATPGDGAKALRNPTGVSVDKNGNVYVADQGNNRIVAFKPDGSLLAELKIDKPEHVVVNRATGAVYVMTVGRELHKFTAINAVKAVAQAKVPIPDGRSERAGVAMAVDETADPALVWVSTGGTHYSAGRPGEVFRYEDHGDTFAAPVPLTSLAGNNRPSAGAVLAMALDRKNQRLILDTRAYDLASGKWGTGFKTNTGSQQGIGSFGLDGNFYIQTFGNYTTRFSPYFKPLPFGDAAGIKLPFNGSNNEIRGRGITADFDGNIYLARHKGLKGYDPTDFNLSHNIVKLGPDGKMIDEKLVDSQFANVDSVRIDLQGNIYLVAGVRPAGATAPPGMKGEFGTPWKKDLPATQMEWYRLLYGCIIKFPPSGGIIRAGSGGVPVLIGYSRASEVKGALWMHYGASPAVSWRNGAPDVCFCESARFDVDRFGRCFYPDAGRFRVGMLDTAGNPICTFGAYGNVDSAGPGSAIPSPPIPFFWPYMIEVDGGLVYVGDRMNRRVVVVKLDHAATAETPLP